MRTMAGFRGGASLIQRLSLFCPLGSHRIARGACYRVTWSRIHMSDMHSSAAERCEARRSVAVS